MIISASSRTDIPAFFGQWFENRLAAGYCVAVNAFNGAAYRVGLRKDEVDGFVFWTKNVAPFLPRLEKLRARGFPFVLHYTINGYPRELEPSIPPAEMSIERLHLIARTYGARVGIWRYDPILITTLTDFGFHRRNFARLAGSLAGAVDQVAVAYALLGFRRTRRNLNRLAHDAGLRWEDPDDERKREFLIELAAIAKDNGITLRLCAQPQYLSPEIQEASCIDARRLSEIAGRPIRGQKPGHRGKQCACDYSRDVGAYDTCLHGCAYCYAVADFRAAKNSYRQHDPTAEWLCLPRQPPKKAPHEQLPLFCWDR